MARIEYQVMPDEYYSAADIEKLFKALERRIKDKEVMHTKDAAVFLGISANKLYQMKNVPSHKVPEISGRLYLRSELIEYIKRH